MSLSSAPVNSSGAAPPPTLGLSDEPAAAAWLFNHPSLGLTLRYHLKPLLLSRLALVQAIGLLGMLLLASQLHTLDDELQVILERLPIGRIIFILTAASEIVFLTLVLPLTLTGIFSRERRERCFDQVVATGISPLRLLGGRAIASLAAMAFLTLTALPFLIFGVASGAVPASELLLFLFVLAVYLTGLTALLLSLAVTQDDLILPILMSLAVLIGHLIALSPIPTVVAAASPLRMLLEPIQQEMGWVTVSGWSPDGILFGQPLPAATLCVVYWTLITGFSLFRCCMGPDHILTGGLASFDAVALGSGTRARATHSIVGRGLLRQIQMAFLYENLPARLRKLEPLNHEIFRLAGCLCLMTAILGALWPNTRQPTFGQIESNFVWPFISLATVIQLRWCLYGTSARNAALDPRPTLRLAGTSLGRRTLRRVALVIMLAAPATLLLLYPTLSSATVASIRPSVTLPVLGLLAIYASALYGLATVLSYMISIRMLAGAATIATAASLCLAPLLILPLLATGLLPMEATAVAEICPIFAIGSLAAPGSTFNVRIATEVVRHSPSAIPSVLFFIGIAAGCALSAYRQRPSPGTEHAQSKTPLAKSAAKASAVAAFTMCLLGPSPQAQAQESAAELPQTQAKDTNNDITIDSEAGIGGFSPNRAWTPIRIRIRSSDTPFQGTLWLMDKGTRLQQRKVSLPAHGTTHLSFTLGLQSNEAWTQWQPSLSIVLVEEGGKRRFVSKLKVTYNTTPLVAILDERGVVPVGKRTLTLALQHVPATSAGLLDGPYSHSVYDAGSPREEIMVVFPELAMLPHNPLAFSGLCALVLSDISPESLSAGVWRGIVGWVHRGGHLLVTGGQHSRRLASPALAKLLAPASGNFEQPAVIRLSETPRLTSLASVIAKSSPPGPRASPLPTGTSIPTCVLSANRDDQVLLSETTADHGNLPLILRRRAGLGAVTLIAMSPLDPPLGGTPMGMTLLETALQSGPVYDEASGSLYDALTPLRADTSFLEPVMGWLSLYLLVLVVTGIGIRRWSSSEFAIWLWLPALGIAFAVATPLATLVGEQSSSLAEISLLESTNGSDIGLQTSGVLLWSSNGDDISLTATGDDPLAFTIQRTAYGHRGKKPFLGPPDPASGGLSIGPLEVPRWNSRSLIAESLRPAQVTARVIVGPGTAQLELRNHLDQPLKRMSVTLGIPDLDRKSKTLLGMVLKRGAATEGPGTPVLTCRSLADLAAKSRMVTRLRGRSRGSGTALPFPSQHASEVEQTIADKALTLVWSQRLALRTAEYGEAWILAEIEPSAPRGVTGSPLIKRRADVQLLAIRPTLHWQGLIPFGVSRRDIHRPSRRVIQGKRQPQTWETRLELPSFIGANEADPLLEGARLVVRGLRGDPKQPGNLEIENVRTGRFEPLKTLALGDLNSTGNNYIRLGDEWISSRWNLDSGQCFAATLPAQNYVRMPEQVVRLRETVPPSQMWDSGMEQLTRLDIGVVWPQRKR